MRPPTRCAGDTPPCRWRSNVRGELGLTRCGIPVADDPRRGMLGLLAGRHRSVPYQRRHRRRGAALLRATGDTDFEADRRPRNFSSKPPGYGARSATRHPDGRFRIDGVTGPDEYSAVADNNVYTNLMAQQNLRCRRRRRSRHPDLARDARGRRRRNGRLARRRRGHVHPVRPDARRPPSGRRLYRPRKLGLRRHPAADRYPLLLNYPYFDLYRKQVVKQADLVLAMHRRTDAFTPNRRPATSPTTNSSPSATPRCPPAPKRSSPPRSDTSTSPTTTSAEAALMDLDDLEHNTRDGLHIASLAGSWIAVISGWRACGTKTDPSASHHACPTH